MIIRDTPWALTEIQTKPSGLRECVLRVDFLDLDGAKTLASCKYDTLLHKVARWRVHNPSRWAFLLDVVRLSGKAKES